MDVPSEMRCVCVAAIARMVTASGLIPATVDQAVGTPARSASRAVSSMACGAGRTTETPIGSVMREKPPASLIDHPARLRCLHGGRYLSRLTQTAAELDEQDGPEADRFPAGHDREGNRH